MSDIVPTSKIWEPGIYPELSEREYYAIRDGKWPALNQTLANELLKKSPAHAHAKFIGWAQRETTKSLDTGQILHKLLLGRGKQIVRLDFADYRTKDAQTAKKEAYANGCVPVLKEEHAEYEVAAKVLEAQLFDRGIELSGQSEVSLIWRSSGVLCKSMLDHLILDEQRAIVYDLKSIVSADQEKCAKHCIEYGYDVQRSAYLEGLETVKPELAGRVTYKWIFFEAYPPYALVVRAARGTMRERGERRWKRAKARWSECVIAGKWQGYADGDLEAPPWSLEMDDE